ncbi:MAG: hypothetical protein RMJ53_01785 [Chitinophagales bacterium]|nr:hypothetical protein [Chitinophagales bacterium]MDW8272940.1 hypothetical protein [Chitinophagales bacterium]
MRFHDFSFKLTANYDFYSKYLSLDIVMLKDVALRYNFRFDEVQGVPPLHSTHGFARIGVGLLRASLTLRQSLRSL